MGPAAISNSPTMTNFNLFSLFIAVVVVVVGSGSVDSQTFTDGKLFLLGGATKDSSRNIYEALKASTGKPSPKIAVVISAASSLAIGLEAYYETIEDSLSYQQLFTDYGFQPSVVMLAIDNYEQASSSLSELGRENIEKIRNADV